MAFSPDNSTTAGQNAFVPCSARYYLSGSSTTPNLVGGAGYKIIDFDHIDWDTDSAVTAGASWKFTVPATKLGLYQVTYSASWDSSSAVVAGDQIWLGIDKNGATATATAGLPYSIRNVPITGSYAITEIATGVVSLNTASDYISPTVRYIGTATTHVYTTNAAFTMCISIDRIGAHP